MRGGRFQDQFPATAFLLLLNVAFFALEVIQHVKIQGGIPQPLNFAGVEPAVTEALGTLKLEKVEEGQYWRLIAAAFLHGGFLHIALNMLVLVDLGRTCEPLLSSWKFFTGYVICALGGAAGSLLSAKLRGNIGGSVGASGAIFGLVGILLGHAIRERDAEMRSSILRWLIWTAVMTLAIPNVDHAGHAGGFFAGVLFGLTARSYMTSTAAARWRIPGYIASIAVAVCLAIPILGVLTKR